MSIDFTINNLFWAIFGSIIGMIISHYWTKYQDKKRLFVAFFCRSDYDDKCYYLYVSIHNEGNKPLPNLSVKIKGTYPNFKNIYFENVTELDELKPEQYSIFRSKLTNSKLVLIDPWLSLLNEKYYGTDNYIKIEQKNSGVPIIYSNSYAVRAMAQVQYYVDKQFNIDGFEDWKWLDENIKQSYIKKIERKYHPRLNWFFKLLIWDKKPFHYHANHYKDKRNKL